MENIINKLWKDVEKNKNYYRKWMRLYNWMSKDRLSSFIKDGNIFYFEKISSNHNIPKYIYIILKDWGKKQGLIYIGDIKIK